MHSRTRVTSRCWPVYLNWFSVLEFCQQNECIQPCLTMLSSNSLYRIYIRTNQFISIMELVAMLVLKLPPMQGCDLALKRLLASLSKGVEIIRALAFQCHGGSYLGLVLLRFDLKPYSVWLETTLEFILLGE